MESSISHAARARRHGELRGLAARGELVHRRERFQLTRGLVIAPSVSQKNRLDYLMIKRGRVEFEGGSDFGNGLVEPIQYEQARVNVMCHRRIRL